MKKGGGFYIFKDVLYDRNMFVDIWILIANVQNDSDLRIMKAYDGLSNKKRL